MTRWIEYASARLRRDMQHYTPEAKDAAQTLLDALERPQCAAPGTNHSPDLIEIWSEQPAPTILCGYHLSTTSKGTPT